MVITGLDGGLRLVALFYGSKGNVLLTSDQGIVIDSFKNRKAVLGSTVSIHKAHSLPSTSPAIDSFLEEFPDEEAQKALKRALPGWRSLLIKETLSRASISASTSCRNLLDEEKVALNASIHGLVHELENPKPRIYFEASGVSETPVEFSLVKLSLRPDLKERMFHDINEAIRLFIARSKARAARSGERHEVARRLELLLEKTQRSSSAIANDLALSSRAEEYERYGNLLMSNLQTIRKGMRSITLSDFHGTATITLAPDRTPAVNAQMYFEKAKKSREARRQAEERLQTLNQKLVLLERLIKALPKESEVEEMKRFREQYREELERVGLRTGQAEQEQLPFRIFTVEGGFQVWAGKSNENNDLLTLKHAKPNDLWFHARGVGGSHVVLKVGSARGEPGKKARTQAAGIAAYYSKMKNAKLVPVAVTLKKYVRKPKGAPAGTVVIQREEVILVEPKLPPMN
jgi:predicted ribosome quality control (RQC) complex YloA/Tae2 family protein